MGLQTVEIIMEVEDRFGIDVADEVASTCLTVGDLQRAVVDRLVADGRVRTPALNSEVFNALVGIIVDCTGLAPAEVYPHSRWIGDITKYG